jgi:small-conductance mechanosensitive channel
VAVVVVPLILLTAAVAPLVSSVVGAAPQSALFAPAADRDGDVALASGASSISAPFPVPLVLRGDTITTFRASVRGSGPVQRAGSALERLEALPRAKMLAPVWTEPIERGTLVLVGDTFAFVVLDEDVAGGQTDAEAAELARQRLGAALTARYRELAPARYVRGVILSLVGLLVVLGLLWLLRWVRARAMQWIATTSPARGGIKVGDVDFTALATTTLSWILQGLTGVGDLVFAVLWVVFVLNRFPETQGAGAAARSTILNVLHTVQLGVLRALPGLLMVAVITLVARLATRVTTDIFDGIERGTILIPAMHKETAGATRRLLIAVIWLFALAVAYPLIPGSDSVAFKGLSVFLGLLVTLGSTGIASHLMSGLVLVYSRSMRVGDYVEIGGYEGKVAEIGALSVKITGARREEFTIPNAVVVGTTVKDYSRLMEPDGSVLTTSVSIGYDAPWRVVYELLLAAAERTPGLGKQPAPAVFQADLIDYAVVYQLVVRLEPSAHRLETLSLLHQNIQDAFNERGIQIMSPRFVAQPGSPVVVPKAKWNLAPGDRS